MLDISLRRVLRQLPHIVQISHTLYKAPTHYTNLRVHAMDLEGRQLGNLTIECEAWSFSKTALKTQNGCPCCCGYGRNDAGLWSFALVLLPSVRKSYSRTSRSNRYVLRVPLHERSNRIDGRNTNPNVDRGTGRRRFVNAFSTRRSQILAGFDAEISDFGRFRYGDLRFCPVSLRRSMVLSGDEGFCTFHRAPPCTKQ